MSQAAVTKYDGILREMGCDTLALMVVRDVSEASNVGGYEANTARIAVASAAMPGAGGRCSD
jgi:hypothetical protein